MEFFTGVNTVWSVCASQLSLLPSANRNNKQLIYVGYNVKA